MNQAERKAAYLASIELNGSPSTARRVVGVTARCIKLWHDDLEFAAEVDDALAYYQDQIKLETVTRAKASDQLQSQVFKAAHGAFGKSSTTINVSAVAQANAAASLSVMSDGELIDRLPERLRLYVAALIANQLPMLIRADRKRPEAQRHLGWLDAVRLEDLPDAAEVAALPAPDVVDDYSDLI